jgi:hypothetical protein
MRKLETVDSDDAGAEKIARNSRVSLSATLAFPCEFPMGRKILLEIAASMETLRSPLRLHALSAIADGRFFQSRNR